MKLVPAEVVNQTKEMGTEGGREAGRETTPTDTVVVGCGFKAALQLNSPRERTEGRKSRRRSIN